MCQRKQAWLTPTLQARLVLEHCSWQTVAIREGGGKRRKKQGEGKEGEGGGKEEGRRQRRGGVL